MSSDADLESLSRDELEQRVRDLEERLDQIEEQIEEEIETTPSRGHWNHLLARLCQIDVHDYDADPFRLFDEVDEVGGMVKRHESVIEEHDSPTADSKSAAWQNVVDVANNLHGTHDHYTDGPWVGLYWQDVKSATGYSDRRCKELVHEFGDEKEGTRWRPYDRSKRQRKRLDINTTVWGDG